MEVTWVAAIDNRQYENVRSGSLAWELTSLAVQVQEVEDTGTAALGNVVGDAVRARAVEVTSSDFDSLLGGGGDGQGGEEGDDGGELHLENFLLFWCSWGRW